MAEFVISLYLFLALSGLVFSQEILMKNADGVRETRNVV